MSDVQVTSHLTVRKFICSLSKQALRSGSVLSAVLFALLPFATLGQTPLVNGTLNAGAISTAGEVDSWTFAAQAGSGLMVRVGATNVTPRIRVFGPDAAQVAETTSGNAFVRDGFVVLQATNAGVYTVLVSATVANQTGSYGLTLAQAPEAFETSPGDQGGALVNGTLNSASLVLGDLDLWSFNANQGDRFTVRVGSPAFTPWIRVYGPSGALVGETTSGNLFTRDGWVAVQAAATGKYTVVVGATGQGQSGDYSLTLAQVPEVYEVSPGDEGGPIASGASYPGTIPVGDLDLWNFTAPAGASVAVRVGSPDITPWIRVYNPSGVLAAETTSGNAFTRDGQVSVTATNAGNYTVVIGSAYTQSGSYTLSLGLAPAPVTITPGDQGGPLTNGVSHAASLTVGDLDVWTFQANPGDGCIIRMGSPDVTPWIRVFNPNGALVQETVSGNSFTRDGWVFFEAALQGTYTVIVGATTAGQSGAYTLTLAQAPGLFVTLPEDQGGALTNGVSSAGTLTVGDLDLWSFSADVGNNIMLRVGSPSFTPWIRVYGPNGALAAETTSGNAFTRDGSVTLQATNSGVYTVVVSAVNAGQNGDYTLAFAQAPKPILVSTNDEGGALTNGWFHSAALNLGDIDVWSFYGTPGDSNVLRVVSTNFTPWIRLYGPSGDLLKETTSGNSFTRQGFVNLNITNSGIYTLIVSASYPGQAGSYSLKESRVPPDLNMPETAQVDEGDRLEVTLTAQDPDEPVKPLAFSLLSGPPGLTLQTVSATNALITWATTEADGPSTNTVVATVTDTVGGKAFTRTNSFTVVVREINLAPQLTVPASQTLDELTPLRVQASATDADLPANPLTFSLVGAPAGLTIDPATGTIAWNPTEAQGPSTNVIAVVVTDSSPSAANEQQLSTTNSFTVIVREVNLRPRVTAPPDQQLDELTSLSVSASAADDDLPANSLAFSLAAAPAGMTINPQTGAIVWTPTEAQGPSTNVIAVVITDNSPFAANEQHLSATNLFTVLVREINLPPRLTAPPEQRLDELTSLNLTVPVADDDLPANTLVFSLSSAPTGMTIDPQTGAIAWTPAEAQGPSTNIVTIQVQDNGAPPLTSTTNFTVIVNEANTAPVLPNQASRTIDELTALTVNNQATDSDLPANTFKYTLVSGPANATISAEGVISWTPTEAQGPSTNTFTTIVADNGTPALTATNTFIVVVNEINLAPALQPIEAKSLHYGLPLTVQASASDPDLPANMLTYSLDQPPANMSIDAQSGLISWTPAQNQAGAHSITVRVTDNASPALSASTTFQVNVSGEGSSLQIERLDGGLIQLTIDGDLSQDYELQKSSDLVIWETLVKQRRPTYIDPDSKTDKTRFYRIKFGGQ